MTLPVGHRTDYVGTGLVATYGFTFKVFVPEDLQVTVRNTAGVETALVLDVQFRVNGDAPYETGGTVTLLQPLPTGAIEWPLPAGWLLAIRRVVPLSQETDVRNQSTLHLASIEDALDVRAMVDQQQQDEIDRALKASETSTGVDFTLPPPIPGMALLATADGLGVEWGAAPMPDPLPPLHAGALHDLNASELKTGIVPDPRFPAVLPAVNGGLLTGLNADALAIGTIPPGRFPPTLPPVSGAPLTDLNADELKSGTVPDARFPAVLPAVSGERLTSLKNLNADELKSGTVPDARFPAVLPPVSGAQLTNLDAADLVGPIPPSAIPANVARRDAANTFTGSQTVAFPNAELNLVDTSQPVDQKGWKLIDFGGQLYIQPASDGGSGLLSAMLLQRSGAVSVPGVLTAGGLGATPLDAAQLATGTVPVPRLPQEVVRGTTLPFNYVLPPPVPNKMLKCRADGLGFEWADPPPAPASELPIGTVLVMRVATNPNVLLGYGVWVEEAQGQALVGRLAGDPEFGTGLAVLGSKTVALTEAQLAPHAHTQAAHGHGVNDGGHNHLQNQHYHVLKGTTHGHGVNDPTHAHGVYDPGHNHTLNDPTHNHGGSGLWAAGIGGNILQGGGTYQAYPGGGGTDWAATGMWLDAALSGIGIYGAGTGITIAADATLDTTGYADWVTPTNVAAVTGVSIQAATPAINAAGGGAAHNNIQPSKVFWIWARTA